MRHRTERADIATRAAAIAEREADRLYAETAINGRRSDWFLYWQHTYRVALRELATSLTESVPSEVSK